MNFPKMKEMNSMSTFAVPVTRIAAIESIDGADAIEVAVVGDYRSVVQKGVFRQGQLVVYIPEAAVLPNELIVDLGLEGKLAGSHRNRVKAIKLRGQLSQGLIYDKVPEPFVEEDDVAEQLGIVKYEPHIPAQMAGAVVFIPPGMVAGGEPIKYDIQNFKAKPF